MQASPPDRQVRAAGVNLAHLERIGATSELASLHQERLDVEKELRDAFAKLVNERTFFKLASSMKGTAKAVRPFTTSARAMQKGLAFRSKGSIGVVVRRRDMSA
jgi:hypothetical protein